MRAGLELTRLVCNLVPVRCFAQEVCLLTAQAAAKRYKITGSGKVFTRRPGKQHINEKKSPKRLRALGKEKEIDHGDKRKVVRCLPYANIK